MLNGEALTTLLSDATSSEVSHTKKHTSTKMPRHHALLTGHIMLSKGIEIVSPSTTPIHKLPPETLSTIFELCTLNDDEAPLSFYRVCKHWGEVLECPRVWSRIVIHLNDLFAEEKARLYLKRSRSALLHIEFHRPNYFPFIDSGWRAWAEMLVHAKRWRTLTISASTFGDVNEVLEDLPDFLPNLVHTNIHVEGTFTAIELRQPRLELGPKFSAYSRFHSLHLQGWALPLIPARQLKTSVFSYLKRLHITDTYASTFTKNAPFLVHPICGNAISAFLNQCVALETFIFDARGSVERHSGRCCVDPSGSASPLYTLRALKHLVLMAHRLDTLTIINHLVLPALRTAYIEPLPRYSSNLSEKLGVAWRGLFERSQQPLLEKLHVVAMDPEDVMWTLEQTPHLTRLHVTHFRNPAMVLEELARRRVGSHSGSPWLCPSLQWLSFAECDIIPWKKVALCFRNRHRAHQRRQELSPMVKLIMNGHDVLEDRDRDSLATFKLWHIVTLIEP